MNNKFLPISREDMNERGWEQCDFIIVTGDAYVELGDTKKGISKYLEAAEYGANSFNTPLFLIKAAELYELEGKYSEALGLYEQIQDEYPESTEGQSIEKYIARVKLLNE